MLCDDVSHATVIHSAEKNNISAQAGYRDATDTKDANTENSVRECLHICQDVALKIIRMQSELQSVLSHEDLMGTCVLVFANKQDLKDALTVEELTQKLSLHSIKAHDWHIQSCCAVAGIQT